MLKFVYGIDSWIDGTEVQFHNCKDHLHEQLIEAGIRFENKNF